MTTTNTTRIAVIILALLAFVLASCNTNNSHQADHGKHEHGNTNTNKKELALNNGNKWKMDNEMNMYVDNMQKIANDFKSKNSTDYNSLAANLRPEITTMVTNCKMTGAEHDALHVWLEPLMDDVKGLASKNETEARAAYESAQARLEIYDTYFE